MQSWGLGFQWYILMSDPRRENLNAVSGDSLRNNERHNESIQTEWNHMQAYNHEVVYEKGHCNEIEGTDIFNHSGHHRKNITGENASARGFVQLPGEPCGYSTKDITTSEAETDVKRKKRPLVLTAQDAAGSSRPRQARKSSSRELRTCKHVNPVATIEPSSVVGNEERGGYKALRKRVHNAGDDSWPRQAGKQIGQSSESKCQKSANIGQDAAVQQSSDVGHEGSGGYRALRIRADNAANLTRPRQSSKQRGQSAGNKRQKSRGIADVSQPRQAGKRRGQSSDSKRQKRENVNEGVPMVESSDVGSGKNGRYRALRIRAING